MPKKKQDDEEVDEVVLDEEDEDAEEEEESEEESDEEAEDEEDEGESEKQDEYALLPETYSDLLCLGYSPAQLDKLLPPLAKHYEVCKQAQIKECTNSIGPELAQAVADGYDEFFIPAMQEFMRALRREIGADHAKMRKVLDWLSARFLRTVLYDGYVQHMTSVAPWPKPENG